MSEIKKTEEINNLVQLQTTVSPMQLPLNPLKHHYYSHCIEENQAQTSPTHSSEAAARMKDFNTMLGQGFLVPVKEYSSSIDSMKVVQQLHEAKPLTLGTTPSFNPGHTNFDMPPRINQSRPAIEDIQQQIYTNSNCVKADNFE